MRAKLLHKVLTEFGKCGGGVDRLMAWEGKGRTAWGLLLLVSVFCPVHSHARTVLPPPSSNARTSGEAAVMGATAVVQGFVTPINPTEPRKSHVYVYNNIFFSYAADTCVDGSSMTR